MTNQRAEVLGRLGVSRETAERLDIYAAALRRWSPHINLVSRASLSHLWPRHIEDSAQLLRFAPSTARTWIDLGSGAGLPGLVVATLASERARKIEVTLVESDQRKAVFLRTVAREMGLTVTVLDQRIEALSGLHSDVISARAVAHLGKLLEYAEPLRATGGIYVFPKGAAGDSELTEVQQHWHIRYQVHRSVTDPSAAIFVIQEAIRVDASDA